jgi:dTDP-4-amino-4,6-dideoxygalactose transaminase
VKYQHDLAGYNSRLDEMQAAFLRAKLAVLDEWNARRREIATLYSKLLAATDIGLPLIPGYAEPVWHLYVIRSKYRDALKTNLEQQGVSTVIHYPIPPHRQACYRGFQGERLPIAERLSDEVLSLPMSPAIRAEEVGLVASTIATFLGNRSRK